MACCTRGPGSRIAALIPPDACSGMAIAKNNHACLKVYAAGGVMPMAKAGIRSKAIARHERLCRARQFDRVGVRAKYQLAGVGRGTTVLLRQMRMLNDPLHARMRG